MIANTSIFVVRYVSPILYLASILLATFAFLGPAPLFHTSVALVTVSPMNITTGTVIATSNVIIKRNHINLEKAYGNHLGGYGGWNRRFPRRSLAERADNAAAQLDGPSVFIGALGSCQRTQNGAAPVCTNATWFPIYTYTNLPSKAPVSALPLSPPRTSPITYLISLVLSVMFFFLTLLCTLAELLPKPPGFLTKLNTNHLVSKLIAWLGILAFIMGLLSSLVWRVSFGRDVEEFNTRIVELFEAKTPGTPMFVASLGNGFTMMWVAFAFAGPLLICALFKLHVQAAGAAKA